MNSISTQCLVILVTLCLVQQAKTMDLVSQTCGNAKVLYKDLCEKTLRADPKSQSADIQGLAKIALAAASSDVKALGAKISELLEVSSDEDTRKALQDCSENYDSASDQIDQSIPAMEAKRFSDVNAYVSAAMTNGDTCEEGFKKGSSLLTQENEDFGHLCSNVLAISNQVTTA